MLVVLMLAMVARRETVLLVLTMDRVDPVVLRAWSAVTVKAWRCAGVKRPAAFAFWMARRVFRMASEGEEAAVIAPVKEVVDPPERNVDKVDVKGLRTI